MIISAAKNESSPLPSMNDFQNFRVSTDGGYQKKPASPASQKSSLRVRDSSPKPFVRDPGATARSAPSHQQRMPTPSRPPRYTTPSRRESSGRGSRSNIVQPTNNYTKGRRNSSCGRMKRSSIRDSVKQEKESRNDFYSRLSSQDTVASSRMKSSPIRTDITPLRIRTGHHEGFEANARYNSGYQSFSESCEHLLNRQFKGKTSFRL